MKLKKNFSIFIAALFLVGLTGGFYAVSPVIAVALYDDEGEERFVFTPPGGRFTIHFLHSWARTPVDEIFQIDAGNNIVLKETIYEDFGAGLPYEPEPGRPLSSMVVANGKIHIRDIDRIVPDLQLRTGRFVAAHALVYGDKRIPFSDIVAPGSVVAFKARNIKRCLLWIQKN